MSVLFANRNIVKPGVHSTIDVKNLVPTSTGSAAVVAIVGECTGGQPGVVHWFNDPAKAASVLKSGPALDAARFAWSPTKEPNLAGADLVAVIRVNPAEQSMLALTDASAGQAVQLDSIDYGADTTNIKAKVEAGTASSSVKLTVTYGTVSETFDNLLSNAALVAAVNDPVRGSKFVTATKKGDTIVKSVAYTNLAGGVEGTTTNTEWTDAITALRNEWVDFIVPLTEDSSIHTLFDAHAVDMSNRLAKERRIFCGVTAPSAADTTSIISAAQTANSPRMYFCGLGVKRVNSAGVLTTYAAPYLAAMLAGMAAGAGVVEPLTNKLLNVEGLSCYFDDDTIVELLQAGVITAEKAYPTGFKVTQSISTWTTDETPVYKELSVGRVADGLNVRIRRAVNKLAGRPGSATFPESVLNAAIAELKQAERDGWIFGTPETPAFRNIMVRREGDAYWLDYEASPTQPANYILITGHIG